MITIHTYLRSIGFSRQPKTEFEIQQLLDNFFHTCDQRKTVRQEDGKAFFELSKSFGPNMGIRVCGEVDGFGFHRQYYFPYLEGRCETTDKPVIVDPRMDGTGFYGEAEDGRVDFSLIFFLQNPVDFMENSFMGYLKDGKITTTLTGLSTNGIILLPGKSDRQGTYREERRDYYRKHEQMVTAAKNGSQEAIESLTMEDMDTYAMISRRIQREDILTIIDSYFMPYGMESDQYQIMGSILFHTKIRNSITNESVYQITVDCNGMLIEVCINSQDLYGEPEEGRRFKGNIWLQGRLNLPAK